MVDNVSVIENAIAFIKDLFYDNADGHDVDHSLRVYHNAVSIAPYYNCDLLIVSLAAILHDVDDHKLFHTENNENARIFLEGQNIGEEKMEYICDIINDVSFSKNKGKRPKSIEGKIVQDADRLDAIGAIGVARTFAYGGKVGRTMKSSIQHFYEKLLLLKETMNTQEAREMAINRHDFMEQFLTEYGRELKE